MGIRTTIMVQILARSVKNEIRLKFRTESAQGHSTSELLRDMLEMMNHITGAVKPDNDSTFFNELLMGILKRFGSLPWNHIEIPKIEFNFIDFLTELNCLDRLIHQITEMSAINYGVGFEKKKDFHKFSFTEADLMITTRSKQFDTMDYSLASMFEADAKQQKDKNNFEAAKRLYSLSAKH